MIKRTIERQRSQVWMRLTFLLLGLLSFGGPAQGHSDPWGDVHPKVSAIDGKFSIIFQSLRKEQALSFILQDSKPYYRMVYDIDGKLISPRHSLQEPMHARACAQERPFLGHGKRLDRSTTIFEENRTGYLLKSDESKMTKIRLPWPKNGYPDLIEGILAISEGIAITGKERHKNTFADPLHFYWFAHDSTTDPVKLTIGNTECIYHFPVASNPVYAGGKFWMAFMSSNEQKETILKLWSWKIGEKKGQVETLNLPAHWNSSLYYGGDRKSSMSRLSLCRQGAVPRKRTHHDLLQDTTTKLIECSLK